MKQEMYINRKKILNNEEHTLPPKRITKVFAQDTWLTIDEEGHRIREGRTPSGFIQPEGGGKGSIKLQLLHHLSKKITSSQDNDLV